ncbi:MAG: hypothetical protein L3J74_15530 [Bacteroidales bacterium]|nr:hypothetical protein [Bacteroidales bacterium]
MKNVQFIFILIVTFLMSCRQNNTMQINRGVIWELAKMRKAYISNIEYNLSFNIPKEKEKKIRGVLNLNFSLLNKDTDLILDFNVPKENLLSVHTNN